MATASASNPVLMKSLTDCMYFINGHCKLAEKCHYRHCREAAEQNKNCFKWPATCRNASCRYRHPAILPKAKPTKPGPIQDITPPFNEQPPPVRPQHPQGLVSFFWDIENVPIPKTQKPFDIVQRIRQKLVIELALREYTFSCYCNSTSISEQNQLSLHHANVRIVHVPDRKPGAVDRQILLDLDRFERAHRPPATVVLISGDIDFVGKLSDLRHQAGFHVIVIHNKPAKEELKLTVNAHYPWEAFTQPQQQQQTNEPNVMGALMDQPTAPRSRMRHPSGSGNLWRTDPSPSLAAPSSQQKPGPTNTNKKQQQKRISHPCPQCTNEFDSIQALRQHQEAKDHVFECPVCDEDFFTLDGQIQHQKDKNHQEQKFKCAKCDRNFASDSALNQHKQATGHVDILFPPSSPPLLTTNGFQKPSTPPPPYPASIDHILDNGADQTALIMRQGIAAIMEVYRNMQPKK